MTAAVRPDAGVKLDGTAVYGTDLDVPGMLWAAFVPAPMAHGRIRSLDLRGARALPGVTVIGPEDLPRLLGPGDRDLERPLFAFGEITYRNQPLALVAAPSALEARAAVAAVRVEVEPLPIVADLESVFPEWPGSSADASPHVAGHVRARHGNVESEFATADRVVSETYRTASVHQVALEPHACVAEIRGETWYVRTSTQTPFGVREDAAALLGVPGSFDRGRRYVGRWRVRREGKLVPRAVRPPHGSRDGTPGTTRADLRGGVPVGSDHASGGRPDGHGGHGRPDPRTAGPPPAGRRELAPRARLRHRLLDRIPARPVPDRVVRGRGVRASGPTSPRSAPTAPRSPLSALRRRIASRPRRRGS